MPSFSALVHRRIQGAHSPTRQNQHTALLPLLRIPHLSHKRETARRRDSRVFESPRKSPATRAPAPRDLLTLPQRDIAPLAHDPASAALCTLRKRFRLLVDLLAARKISLAQKSPGTESLFRQDAQRLCAGFRAGRLQSSTPVAVDRNRAARLH